MDDEPITWFMQVMELMLQAFFFLAELCEQYPVPFLIISQACVILILIVLFCACRPMSSTKLSLLESVRARVSANRDGSIEVSIDARVSEGSSGSGARLGSPEPAYLNSTTNPNASSAEPTEVAQPQAQAKAKAKSRSRARAKPKAGAQASGSNEVPAEVEARLHEWMMQNIARHTGRYRSSRGQHRFPSSQGGARVHHGAYRQEVSQEAIMHWAESSR